MLCRASLSSCRHCEGSRLGGASAPGRRRRGFTLIEVMIALVVVALLSSLAYPAYTAQVNRSRVAQAVADIKDLEIRLERYLTDHGSYPTSLTAAGMSQLDPWGNAYQYLNMEGASTGQVRKDHSLHPLNTDYDLYSMGADGQSVSPLTARQSRDDIVRARNGSFVGLASDY
jgi:general secretion pathway protein G